MNLKNCPTWVDSRSQACVSRLRSESRPAPQAVAHSPVLGFRDTGEPHAEVFGEHFVELTKAVRVEVCRGPDRSYIEFPAGSRVRGVQRGNAHTPDVWEVEYPPRN